MTPRGKLGLSSLTASVATSLTGLSLNISRKWFLLSLVLWMTFFSGKLSCGGWEVMQSTVLAQHSCYDAAKENISKPWGLDVCLARVLAPVRCSTERRLPDLQSILGLYITECKGINLSLHLGLQYSRSSQWRVHSLSLCFVLVTLLGVSWPWLYFCFLHSRCASGERVPLLPVTVWLLFFTLLVWLGLTLNTSGL